MTHPAQTAGAADSQNCSIQIEELKTTTLFLSQ